MKTISSRSPGNVVVRIATLTLAAFCIAPATAQATTVQATTVQATTVQATVVTGRVVDAETGKALPCRLYVQNTDTFTWHFAKCADAAGSAVEYRKQIGATPSVEMHTTLSASKFQLLLEPGKYRIRAEQGKEFLPVETEIIVSSEASELELALKRFVERPKRFMRRCCNEPQNNRAAGVHFVLLTSRLAQDAKKLSLRIP